MGVPLFKPAYRIQIRSSGGTYRVTSDWELRGKAHFISHDAYVAWRRGIIHRLGGQHCWWRALWSYLKRHLGG